MHHAQNEPSPYSNFFLSERDYHQSTPLWKQIPTGLAMIRSNEAARNIARLIADSKPDVAHLHNIYHQITPSILPVLKDAKIPVVLTLHDYKLICPKYSLFDGRAYCYRCQGGRFFQAPVVRCLDGSFVRSALLALEAYWQRISGVYDAVQCFLAPSRYMRDMFVDAGFGEDRVRYLRSFITREEMVESDEFTGSELAGRLPDKFVLYFGRVSEEKGLFTLVDAIRRLGDVPLVICGDGPLLEQTQREVREQAMNQVVFAGFVAKPLLNSVIRRARVVVMPSEWPENAPFTVLESMAAGVPVVVSDMGGLPELAEVAQGESYPHGDAGALAHRIHRLWEDDAHRERISVAGRTAIDEKFSKTVHLQEIEQLYQSLA